MPRHDQPGNCKICGCRTRRASEFCYVHEPYEGAARETIQRARDALQLERTREDRLAKEERAAGDLLSRSAEMTHEDRIASEWHQPPGHIDELISRINENRSVAGLEPLRDPEDEK